MRGNGRVQSESRMVRVAQIAITFRARRFAIGHELGEVPEAGGRDGGRRAVA